MSEVVFLYVAHVLCRSTFSRFSLLAVSAGL